MPKLTALQVAVGVIKNSAGEVLISQRAKTAHQGGLWEFPGGKLEENESAEQALKRELQEELGIVVQHCQPLITIRHDYADLSVLLIVFLVDNFTGVAIGREHQAIKWVLASELNNDAFPEANKTIITATQLPPVYPIINAHTLGECQQQFTRCIKKAYGLVQLRAKQLSASDLQIFLREALPLCERHQLSLLINSAMPVVADYPHRHLTSADLMALTQRPNLSGLIGASCHHLTELKHAESIGLDFAVIAPVLATATHPETLPLGWQTIEQWLKFVNIPVYALGGMNLSHLSLARSIGAQGVSGIRGF